jgi:hypothetical protein
MGRSDQHHALRKRLFNLYNTNLQALIDIQAIRIKPSISDAFVCPLCFKAFGRDKLNVGQAITLEHVPPDFAGGRKEDAVLLCGSCNHTLGAKVVGPLKNVLLADDFLAGIPGASVEGRYSMGDVPLMAAVIRAEEDSTIVVKAQPHRTNPIHTERQRVLLERAVESQELRGKLSFSLGKRPYADIALLNIAYLTAFRVFGYGYIFHPNLQPVRKQIQNPASNILPKYWKVPNSVFPDITPGVYRVTSPAYLRCLLVAVKLRSKLRETTHVVMLPNLTQPGLGMYKWFEDRAGTYIKESVKATELLEDSNYLTNPDLVLVSRSL